RAAAGTRDDGVDIDLATGRVAHLAGIEKARALCDRFEQMTIDGVAVVRVALRPRSNVFPFGQEPDEHAFMVERLEYRNRVRSRTEETNEARALPHVPGRLARGPQPRQGGPVERHRVLGRGARGVEHSQRRYRPVGI